MRVFTGTMTYIRCFSRELSSTLNTTSHSHLAAAMRSGIALAVETPPGCQAVTGKGGFETDLGGGLAQDRAVALSR